MRVFRPQFKDRDTGERRRTEKHYIDFFDHRQHRRRIPAPGCQRERQAQRFGEMLEGLVTARQYGDRPDKKLIDWLHGLPKRTIRKLAEIDLIDKSFVMASTPLEHQPDINKAKSGQEKASPEMEHIAYFEKWLRSTKAKHGFNRDPVYIHNVLAQVRYIVRECGCVYWSDLTKEAVETCLGKLNVASKTYNSYVASIKLFGNWMVENGRAATSPLMSLKPVRWTKTERRRALIQNEVLALLRTTTGQPTYGGMSGTERAILYLTALETGYRMNELRCLTVGCFDLDAASIDLGAEYTKNHLPAQQLIKRARAEQYRVWLAGRASDEPAFPMPSRDNTVLDAFRRDLIAAGIEPINERGDKVLFHCLRHTFGSNLDRSGATDKERHLIGRWSDKGDLSLGVYGHATLLDLRAVIERLPNYPWPVVAEQQREEKVA